MQPISDLKQVGCSKEMPEKSTENILARLQGEDKSALQSLFHLHYKEVCRTIHRFVSDKNQAEDLAQEVFIRLWQKRHQLNINTSFGAYLHRMAINESISFLRKIKRREDKVQAFADRPLSASYTTSTSGEELMLQQELKDQVSAAINALPPRCRAIFQLSRYEQMSYREISVQLEISIKTVEHQMGKALRLLRVALQQHLPMLIAYGLLFLIS